MERFGKWMVAVALTVTAVTGSAMAQESGAAIYKEKCSLCHGDTGKGDTPAGQAFKAASFSDPAVIKVSDAERFTVVKNGKDKMPAFGPTLTDDQIKAVVAYVRTLQK